MAKILVVDDHPQSRKLLVCQLESEGYVVVECDSGEAGLKAAGLDPPDLVMTDSNMPGMSGIEMVARLRRIPQTRYTPVIFHTGSGDESKVRASAATYGVAAILTKPCPAREMFAQIRAALNASSDVPFDCVSSNHDLQTRVPAYLDSCKADLAAMESDLAAGNLMRIRQVGHNLKGTGTAYGFSPITRIGNRIELAALAGDPIEIGEQLKDLACYLGGVTGASTEGAGRVNSSRAQ